MDVAHGAILNIVQHVAVDLRRQHNDGGVSTIHRYVASEQSHPFGPKLLAEVIELLVAERLERRGVENSLPHCRSQINGSLSAHCLATARGC